MKFHETPLKDAFVVDLDRFSDERGFFARTYCQREFEEAGIDETFVQMNLSGNVRAGTLRGLHYQDDTAPEAKFLRCISGAVFDVMVDMRPASPTYRRWFGVELTAASGRAVYVPPLFAHGYLALTDGAQALYQTSGFYAPGAECGVRFDDPSISIDWPIDIADVSQKDRNWPDLPPLKD